MLTLVLFTDAANADLSVLGKSWRIPERLLLIGLPLTILLGYGPGVIPFRELGLLEIAILETMLAPTDAALGKAVFSNNPAKKPVYTHRSQLEHQDPPDAHCSSAARISSFRPALCIGKRPCWKTPSMVAFLPFQPHCHSLSIPRIGYVIT
jgi:hypothetical protein